MPLRFLRGSAGRLTLTVIAVACGVALVCAIDLANRAVLQTFTEAIDTMAGRAALQITAGQGALFPEEVASSATNVTGVELAVPVVYASAFLADGSGEQLSVQGIDITNDEAVRVYKPTSDVGTDIQDPLLFLSRPDSVLIGEQFAQRHGIRVDDSLALDTPSGRRRFTVRGFLASEGIARVRGGNIVAMDIAAAEAAFTRPYFVNRVDVVVKSGADVQEVAADLRAVLPAGLTVEPPAQRKVDLHRVIKSTQTLIQAVGILGLVAAFLIAFSRLSSVFRARIERLAVLRAVGIRIRRIWWELAKESFLVAGAGIAVGLPLGILAASLFLPIITTATSISANLPFAGASLVIYPSSLARAAGLGVGVVFSAVVIPAWRAANVPIVYTLQGRPLPTGVDATPSSRRCLAVTLLALSILGLHIWIGSAGLGIAGSGILVMALALAVRPFLAAAERPIHSLLCRTRPTIRMAFSSLMASVPRTALAVATIGVGFGSVLWLWTLAASFERSVLEVMPGVMRGHLSVTSANIAAGYIEAPMDETVLAALAAIPGVAAASGEQITEWTFANGPISINAFDPEYFAGDTFGQWPLTSSTGPTSTAQVATTNAALVSENFSRHLGIRAGDSITLTTPHGPLVLVVVGVTRDFLSPRGTIEMSRELYKRYWDDHQVVRALLVMRTGATIDSVRTTIARTLGAKYQLQILSIVDLVGWFQKQVRQAFRALNALGVLILIVVVIGVGDALAANILERKREFAILRATGLRRNTLALLVLTEALILAIFGLALAFVLGLTLGFFWVRATFPALLGWTLSLHVPLPQLFNIAVIGVAACLIAAIGPAVRLVRTAAVDALRAD
jgi:putative ABC transport system permease protein